MLSKIRHYVDLKCLNTIHHDILGRELIGSQKTSHFEKKSTNSDLFLNRTVHTVPLQKNISYKTK